VLPPELRFAAAAPPPARLPGGGRAALFAATPHGTTAPLVDAALAAAETAGVEAHAVDLSADFRFADPERFARIYGQAHGAPGRSGAFVCAVPEHHRGPTPQHAAQPGCFTTAVVLAAYPLYALGLAAGGVFVSAVTGSSGSGRTPGPGTHHPERSGNLVAYSPLAHRHEPEMAMLLAPACGGVEPEVEFVPHSGPFVRGILATVRVPLVEPMPAPALAAAVAEFYGGAPFVHVTTAQPRLNEVIGTNACRLGVATRGRTAVVTSVIDNLVKGAAGGGVQWMNRLLGFEESAGLNLAGIGWH
jgi:N-acetyl-gamma-glutamyl-phosphate reductase common form